MMDPGIQDGFLVYARTRPTHADRPEEAEEPLDCYPSYEEAHAACRDLRRQGRDCVVRFQGQAGGGD
jgi:hypothetical protein